MQLTGELALDSSARTTDTFGRLHISKSHISKAAVNPYYGSEIPNNETLGLDPSRIYYLLRDPVELAAAAPTFARLPILSRHVPVTANAPRADLQIGTIGSDIEYNHPYLDADLCFWDAGAIAEIEADTVRELSCAYLYTAVMIPGVFEGVPYDGRMKDIVGNHLAKVESGRAGSDVLAADEAIKTMKKTKLGSALIMTLGAMSPKLAADSAFAGLVGNAVKKTFKVDEVSAKLVAMDAELDPNKAKSAINTILALDADTPDDSPDALGEDDDDEDDDEAKKKKQMAKDAEEKAAEKKMEGAMDALRKDLREADEARRAVREVVGDVIGQDSAAVIYTLALDEMKVGHEGVTDANSLKALFTLANSQKAAAPVSAVIAQDAAGLATRFPEAMRFGQR